MGLEPCPLCIFQRVGVIAVGIVALIALIHNPATFGQTIYSAFGISACVITIGIAARQLWLQSLPADQVPACGPSLNYLMDVFPLMDVLQMVLAGDGSCAEVSWQLLGISIPGWVVIGCIPLLIGNLLVLHRQ
jgi:disulfide bond formation protein DsbB